MSGLSRSGRGPVRIAAVAFVGSVGTLAAGYSAASFVPWDDGSFAGIALAAAAALLAPLVGLVAAVIAAERYRKRELLPGDRPYFRAASGIVTAGAIIAQLVGGWRDGFVVLLIGVTGLVVLRGAMIDRAERRGPRAGSGGVGGAGVM